MTTGCAFLCLSAVLSGDDDDDGADLKGTIPLKSLKALNWNVAALNTDALLDSLKEGLSSRQQQPKGAGKDRAE